MENPVKVLFLARWYPNRYDPMPGLFIQRHAEAVSRFCKVGVVYTHLVQHDKIKGFETDFQVINSVPTVRIYYGNPKPIIPLFSQMLNAYRFVKANYIGIGKIREEIGEFNIIHVHVLTRLGIVALWYKWMKKIPFMISEHWSRYLPLTNNFKGPLRKWMTRIIVKNASSVTTVTDNLASAMKDHKLFNPDYHVLANVVTEDFLSFSEIKRNKSDKTTFIHVSCFENKSKNITGLLHVISSLSKKREDFILKMVGDGMDYKFLKQYARDNGLKEETVVFTGLIEGKALVKEMASADLMVVFSNYENLPVVINESFTLGVPVVATRVGGIPEIVNNTNGRLVDAGDEKELEKILNDFLDGKVDFDNRKIRSDSKNTFSSETIGKELYTIYKSLI